MKVSINWLANTLSALMHGNCSIAMPPSQLLAVLIVVITILGLGLASDVDKIYKLHKKMSKHHKPYKVSEDI